MPHSRPTSYPRTLAQRWLENRVVDGRLRSPPIPEADLARVLGVSVPRISQIWQNWQRRTGWSPDHVQDH